MNNRTIIATIGLAALALVALIFIIWLPEGSALLFFLAPIIAIAVSVSRVNRSSLGPGATAGVLCFLFIMGLTILGGLLGGVEDKASDPTCDAFCTTRTVGWIIAVVGGAVWATVMSLVAFFVAGIIAANRSSSATIR